MGASAHNQASSLECLGSTANQMPTEWAEPPKKEKTHVGIVCYLKSNIALPNGKSMFQSRFNILVGPVFWFKLGPVF